MAVLFRAGYMSADLEIELTNRKIPFEKWGGLKFLEAAHVKDVLAFLRVSDNPRDEVSWYRILMLMPGIGDSTARALMDSMQERSWDPDAFTHLIAPPRARDAHRSLATLLRQLRGVARVRGGRGGRRASVASDIAAIRAIYDAVLKEKYDRPEARLADLDQLRTIAASYPSRTAFLAALALDPPSSTQDLAGGSESESDSLVLSTVHSAKGKEWKAVFLIWAVDGWFPSSRAVEDPDELEEERRLMYVALTRAKDELAVVYPMQVYGSRRGADYSIDQLSRFLDRGVRATMQRIVVEEPGEAPVPAAAPSDARDRPARDHARSLREVTPASARRQPNGDAAAQCGTESRASARRASNGCFRSDLAASMITSIDRRRSPPAGSAPHRTRRDR